MIELFVFNGNIKVIKPETLTSGRVGQKVYIAFDEKWSNLTNKQIIFKACNLKKTIDFLDDNQNEIITNIPNEVLINPGYDLEIAIKGYDSEQEVVIPTKYTRLGYIHQGA